MKKKPLEIIIVSDNHLEKSRLEEVLKRHPDADHFLHCGDSNLAPDLSVMQPFVTVKGNTDFLLNYNDHEWVKLVTGETIWLTHGHRFSVTFNTDELIENAQIMAPIPEIVLYGHTHKVDVKMQKGILVINPGSITSPRDGIHRTYARLQVTPELYDIQIFDVKDHQVIKAFQFPR